MNIVDVVIVALISLFAIRGYLRGLFREVFSLLGLFVGFVIAARYHEPVALLWQDSWRYSPILLQVICFVSVFFIVYLVLNLVGLFLHRSAPFLFLGGFNRLGGVLMGTGKAGLVLGLGLLVLTSQDWVPRSMASQVEHARFVQPLVDFGERVVQFGRSVISPEPGQTSLRPSGRGMVYYRATSFWRRV